VARGSAVLLALALVCAGLAGATNESPRLAFVRYALAGEGHGRQPHAIYVFERGRARRLRVPIDDADSPAWSPDRSRLAFHAGGTVYVARADGTEARGIARGAGPAWSPDGTRLALARQKRDSRLSSIWIVRADGGGERRVTYGSIDLQPSWSRNGRALAFLRIDPRTYASGIWTVRSDGRQLRRILGRLKNVTQPVWSPTQDVLVVSDGARLIVTRPGGAAQRVVARLHADATGARIDPQPAWSRDGRQLAFAQPRREAVGRSDIWLVGADGSGLRRLMRSPGADRDPDLR